MSPELSKEVQSFISAYSDLFTSPSCSDSELCAEVARKVGQHYRPGVTFFTGGKISRFEVSVVTSSPAKDFGDVLTLDLSSSSALMLRY